MTSFLDEMDKLAAAIAAEAQAEAKPLADRIDAFKALTPYWVQKTKRRNEDDPDDENTFGSFTDKIHAAENGNGSDKPGVRGSRRNGN